MIFRYLIVAISYFIHTSGSSLSPTPTTHPATMTSNALFQILPKERQVSDYMKKGDIKRYVLISEKTGMPLSIAVTPCSSEVSWSVYLESLNRSLNSDAIGGTLLQEFLSSDLDTYKTNSSRIGLYIIVVKALYSDTTIQVFVSEEPEPPHAARMAKKPKVRLQPRQRKRRITIKWDQSPIDPHVTEYCLVMSNKKNYTSLCGARNDKYGPYSHGPGPVKGNTSKMGNTGDHEKGNILISCVGSRTHHTIDNLEHGKKYYLSLFAINKQSNLTFPYGSTLVTYDQKTKQSKLRDGKAENVNLRKLDGKAIFKFKAGKQTKETMSVSVMPCGGAVDVIIKQVKPAKIVEQRKRLYSYGIFIISSVHKGERFLIEVKSSDREELRRTTGVEILATTQKKLPLPELPSQTDVREFTWLRNCNSVTVGWLPSPDPTADRYCILARELHRKEMELRVPNQCALDTRLRKNDIFTYTNCFNRKQTEGSDKAMTQKIVGLKPHRKYVVQVTVGKSKGKPLSYDLLTVETNSKCT